MIGLLSNVNIEPIKRCFAGEDLHFVPFGQYRQELVDASSRLYSDDLDRLVVVFDGDELCGDTRYQLPTEIARAAVIERLDNLLALLDQFARARPTVTVTIANFALRPLAFNTHLDANSDASFADLETALNHRLRACASVATGLLVLDWRRIVAQHGYDNLHGDAYWYAGRIRHNQRGLQLLADHCRSLWAAHRGESRKVLVLDLDNTLWQGVVGEVGPLGIGISEDGVGKAFRDFQRAIRALRFLGVVLAIASKNTEAIARAAFDTNSMMVLGWDDFVATRINWQDKASNLAALAQELDLGLDAFVFLDDNPVEREIVSGALPEVAVPEVPTDPAELVTWLYREVVPRYFPRVTLTASDQHKTEQYQVRRQRKEFAAHRSVEDTIRELCIRLRVHVDPAGHRARIAQLTQKTNQFNMTTRRYTEQDVQAALDDPARRVFALEYEDRFGAEGVMGVMLCTVGEGEVAVDNLLLSCRILGRSVEHAFFRAALHTFGPEDLVVRAPFDVTARNQVAAGFYKSCGMTCPEGDVADTRSYSARRSQIELALRDRVLVEAVTTNEC